MPRYSFSFKVFCGVISLVGSIFLTVFLLSTNFKGTFQVGECQVNISYGSCYSSCTPFVLCSQYCNSDPNSSLCLGYRYWTKTTVLGSGFIAALIGMSLVTLVVLIVLTLHDEYEDVGAGPTQV